MRSAVRLALLVFTPLAMAAGGMAGVASGMPMELRRSLQKEGTLLVDLMQGYHYSDRNFTDIDSKSILWRYLEEVDKGKLYLLEGDRDFITRRFEHNLKSVYVFRGDFSPAYEIFDLLVERVRKRQTWLDQNLDSALIFSGKLRSPMADPEKVAWAVSSADLDQRWIALLQREYLELLDLGYGDEEAKARILKAQKAALKTLLSLDAIQVREHFLNALLYSFDAHSGYFSPDTNQLFENQINGSEVGPGIHLYQVGERVRVVHLEAGGPAELDGRIQPNDVIAWVEDGEKARQSALRWNVREAYRHLSGEAGTHLRLGILPNGREPEIVVELERRRVESIEGHAEAYLSEVPGSSGKHRIGSIVLPTFYRNPSAEGGASSTSDDLRQLITKLQKAGAEAILIDLRGNGGGLLTEAVKSAGLFIPKAPVILTRGVDQKVLPQYSEEESPLYKGPLVILLSAKSASASEAFSGALQLYRRALIVGAEASFGKGSVQSYIDLRQIQVGNDPRQKSDWGVLRVTRELYYLPNGESPQQRGIRADIATPTTYRDEGKREAETPNALPNEKANAVLVQMPNLPASFNVSLIPELARKSNDRQKTLPEFSLAIGATALYHLSEKREDEPLNPDAWSKQTEVLKRQHIHFRDEWTKALNGKRYASQRFELDNVETSRRAHQAALESTRLRDGQTRLGRLVGGYFYHVDPQSGECSPIPGSQFDYEYYLSRAGDLASVWNKAGGIPLDEPGARRLLVLLNRHFHDLETYFSEDALLQALSIPPEDQAKTLKALDASLEFMVQLDGEIGLAIPEQDARLREALRITADLLDASSSASLPPSSK